MVAQPVVSEIAESSGHFCRVFLLPSESLFDFEETEIRDASLKRSAVSRCGLYDSYGTAMSGLFYEQNGGEHWSAIGVPGFINNALLMKPGTPIADQCSPPFCS